MLTLPWYCVASSSRVGLMARHGAHQVAVKSTSTGFGDSRTVFLNSASVTSATCLDMETRCASRRSVSPSAEGERHEAQGHEGVVISSAVVGETYSHDEARPGDQHLHSGLEADAGAEVV